MPSSARRRARAARTGVRDPRRTAGSSRPRATRSSRGRTLHDRHGAQRAHDPDREGRPSSSRRASRSPIELVPTLRYDAATDTFIGRRDRDGLHRQRRGLVRVAPTGEALEPGWRTYVGPRELQEDLQRPADPRPVPARLHLDLRLRVRLRPRLVRARALPRDHAQQAGLRCAGRSAPLLVIPFAIPGFLAVLVWQGLLNDDFGVVNQMLHTTSRGSSTRPGPRCRASSSTSGSASRTSSSSRTGALQSIPDELTEAARVDGARRARRCSAR